MFAHLPEVRAGKNDEAYLDADTLPPSDSEDGDEDSEGEGSSSGKLDNNCGKGF